MMSLRIVAIEAVSRACRWTSRRCRRSAPAICRRSCSTPGASSGGSPGFHIGFHVGTFDSVEKVTSKPWSHGGA